MHRRPDAEPAVRAMTPDGHYSISRVGECDISPVEPKRYFP